MCDSALHQRVAELAEANERLDRQNDALRAELRAVSERVRVLERQR